ncbi:ferritin-like domain-containing protein [Azospirillum picis]|uniref:Rubrerythrin n=1 Tax=Azospirillum picis TaxID=488438 RepID=A0ABU0MN45_9PROT|nr:ferritin family protein [Azospirillum picis]MBP2301140.1 rubrerythrin [Azospirillum picis]MDQ0534898.1 rubrerythrin [Azospirillum picis]
MPFLTQEPPGPVASLADLMGIARAMESEAVRRYGQLAGMMDRRGDAALAGIFRALVREEEGHAAAVEHWEDALGLPPADTGAFVWHLPPDIASSWDELAERSSITPYQALSLAVLNEQRAFAFYSYIAAHAEADPVRSNAEALAREELSHAARLRRERRAAFHRERSAHPADTRSAPRHRVASMADFQPLKAALLSAAVSELQELAAVLHGLGDPDGVAWLERTVAELRAADSAALPGSAAAGPLPARPLPTDIAQAVRAAVAVPERLAESFGDIAERSTDESVLSEALRLEELAVGQIALLAHTLQGRKSAG